MAELHFAGIEALLDYRDAHIAQRFTEKGQLFKNCSIISHLNHPSSYPCTKRGLVLPFATGLLIDGVVFINFDQTRNAHDGKFFIHGFFDKTFYFNKLSIRVNINRLNKS